MVKLWSAMTPSLSDKVSFEDVSQFFRRLIEDTLRSHSKVSWSTCLSAETFVF